MTFDTAPRHRPPAPASGIPGWLHALTFGLMTPLLAVVVFFVVGYANSGPGDNLAGVVLILAAVLAIPLVAAILLWGAGFAVRSRHPTLATGLVLGSAIAGGLGVLLLASMFLPALLG